MANTLYHAGFWQDTVVGCLGIKHAIFGVRHVIILKIPYFHVFCKCCGGWRIRVLGAAAHRGQKLDHE